MLAWTFNPPQFIPKEASVPKCATRPDKDSWRVNYITGVHLLGGNQHEHISSVRWLNTVDGVSNVSTVAAMVEWIDWGNASFVGGSDGRVSVGVVRPAGRPAYLRTHADGQWTDNLLALPRF